MSCTFIRAWVGRCDQPAVEGTTRCSDHTGLVCRSCGAPATTECAETMGLVCGAPLCADCEHEIAPDGTNGSGRSWKHVRKGTQKFKSWWDQTPAERLRGEYLMAKREVEASARLMPLLAEERQPEWRQTYHIPRQQRVAEMEAQHPELVGLVE